MLYSKRYEEGSVLISPLHSKKGKTGKSNSERKAMCTYTTVLSSPSPALPLTVLARARRHHPLLLGQEVALIDPVGLFHDRRRRRRWYADLDRRSVVLGGSG